MRVGFVLRVTEIKPLLYRFVEITSFYTILFRFHPPCGMVLLVLLNRTRGGFCCRRDCGGNAINGWCCCAKVNLGPSWKGREVSVSARVSEVPATYQQGTWHGHHTMRPRLIYCKIVLCTAGVVSL